MKKMPENTRKYYPLTHAQKRIYYEEKKYPGTSWANNSWLVKYNEAIDFNLLSQTINLAVKKNDGLRLRIVHLDFKHGPLQYVSPYKEITIDYLDFSGPASESRMHNWLDRTKRIPFQLIDSGLFYFAAVKFNQSQGGYYLNIHHIVADGWSCFLLFREIDEIYKALAAGKTVDDSANPSYIQYIADEQEYLESKQFKKDKEFWHQTLLPLPEAAALSTKKDNPHNIKANNLKFPFPDHLRTSMNEFCTKHETSLYKLVLSALSIYISRLSGLNDTVIGGVNHNRSTELQKQMVGMFVSTILSRIKIDKDTPFDYFVKKVGNDINFILKNHQQYPFDLLATELKEISGKDTGFLRNVAFIGHSNVNGKRFDYEYVFPGSEPGSLLIHLNISNKDKDGLLELEWIYRVEQFSETDIRQFHQGVSNILLNALKCPGKRIAEIELLSREERNRILYEFNDTEVDYPKDQTIHQLFAIQAERTPDNRSIGFRDRQLTYRTLSQRANRLAGVLGEKGVGPDCIAALLVERSLEMMIAIFAVLEAGGTYLPLEAGYPKNRIQYLLTDSNVKLGLTLEKFRGILENADFDGEILYLDHESLYNGTAGNCDSANNPKDSAYIIYTSGSTGNPKGVMIEHRAVVNRLNWMQKCYPIGAGDVILQKTTYVFDVSVWELFWWSWYGASQYLLIPGGEKKPEAIIDALEKNNITTVHFVPSMLKAFLDYLAASGVLNRKIPLRQVFASGEALTVHQVEKFNNLVNKNTKAMLINLYGPTEATVDVSYFNCPAHGEPDKIPIGKPVDNTKLVVVNDKIALQALGLPGELCISGDQLARGYLNRPELTGETFIDNPLAVESAWGQAYKKLYRTGDLCRWLPDGNIEYLGRIDHQVKVRGFRIELGEIENQLAKIPGIKEAVVLAREDPCRQGEKSLCAYLVSEKEPEIPWIRSLLVMSLPDYMVPSYFMKIEQIPFTASGKVDRKSLPAPEVRYTVEYTAPANEIEEILARAWSKVLHLEQVGIHDNFFEIGGDSIKAIQIASLVQRSNLKMEVNQLFVHKTIEQLAGQVKLVDTAKTRKAEQGPVQGKVTLTPIQAWLLTEHSCHCHHFNQAVTLSRKQGFNEAWIRELFTRIVEHHDALRMIYEMNGDTVIQENQGLKETLFHLAVISLEHADDENEVITRESLRLHRAIDLKAGPLVRLGLFKGSSGDHLLIVIHHLVVDGISWRILLEDFETGYRQLEREEKIVFPDKTASFKSWAQKLTEYSQCKTLLKEIPFWQAIEERKVKSLPVDHEIGKQERKAKHREMVSIALSAERTGELLTKANWPYNTGINDLLLTALGLAVHQWTGLEKILIHLEGHGREEVITDTDISRTVGWFTTRYPILLEMRRPGNLSFAVRNVKETLRQVPHKGIGHGILKYNTPGERKKELRFLHTPEILFNYLGKFSGEGFSTFDRVSGITDLNIGGWQHPELEVDHKIDIEGVIRGESLTLFLFYNSREYERETMEKLSGLLDAQLEKLILHCLAKEEKVITPSDLGYPKMSLKELKQITNYIKWNTAKEAKIELIYPLSPMQQGMLYHSLKGGGSSSYFEQMELKINGEIEKSLFEATLNRFIARHDILRTVFAYDALEESVQIVLKERNLQLPYEDLSGRGEEEIILHLDRYKKRDRERGFDLTRDFPVRFSLFKTGPGLDSHHLVFSFHHILMDGWCLGIIFNQLSRIYQQLKEAGPVELEPAAPYSDYIRWLGKQDPEEGLGFWAHYLEEYEQQSGLPKLNSSVKEGEYRLEEYHFTLEETLAGNLNRLALKNRVTVSTLFQTLWGILLQKYNNCNDVVFGVVVSTRPAAIPGIENMLGLLINMIPLRITSLENQTYAQLVKQVQEDFASVRRYDFLSAAEIQSMSVLKGGLVDHIMIFENYPFQEEIRNNGSGTRKDRGFSVEITDVSEQTNYDFNITVLPGKQFIMKFSYNTLVFKSDFVRQIARHLERMIRQIINKPGTIIRQIEMLTEDEKNKLLYEFNNQEVEYPKDKTIHECFEARVEKIPANIAVIFQDNYLTYLEFNKRANQLARVLRQKGLKPDHITALMTERSLEMMIGIFSILKAGGAYLPLEPGFPARRIHSFLEDSACKLLLTSEKFMDTIEFDGDVINLENKTVDDEIKEPGNLDLVNTPKDLAYIIYTSGSTGLPKGVMIEHFSVINRLNWMQKSYPIGRADTILQKTTFVFDVSVWELFWWSFEGASQYLLIPGGEKEPGTIIEAIEKYNISTLHFVPSMLNVFLAYLEGGDGLSKTTCLKQVFASGEALTPAQVEKFNQLVNKRSGASLINLYGPTEATVDVSYFNCPTRGKLVRIPIGKPIDNIKLLVVDFKFSLQALGVPGELFISGDGLARGYSNRPELTTEKFVDNPFAKEEGWGSTYQRFYRSGDLVRWLPDGNIEYLGRIDHQVKIRGFRIETGEIENKILMQQEQEIKEAIVMAREDTAGDKYLCAYIVSDKKVDVSSLNHSLAKNLTDYMVPSYFVQIEKIPLTPSGKVDRKKMPDPQIKAKGENYVAPRNEIENKLVEIWAKILHVKETIIGIDDNFFRLGGHSLKAAVMITMIHKALDVKISIQNIFNLCTLRKLATFIKDAAGEKYSAIKPAEKKEYYPQTPPQKRLYFLEQREKESTVYNMQLMDLYCKGIEKEPLEYAVRKMIRRHESLRTSFFTLEGGAVQRTHDYEEAGKEFFIEYYETTEEGLIYSRPGREEEGQMIGLHFQEAIEHFVRPFALNQPPLLRVGLIKIWGNTRILMLDMHHIISDGVSLVIFLKELWELYDDETLPPLEVQYKDFSEWASHREQREKIRQQEAYWLNEFAGEISVLNLPYDLPRPAKMTFDGDMLHFEIDKDETRKLNRMAQEHGVTMYMILLAVYNVLLAKLSGQEDVIVGTVTAGRVHADLQPIIGMFAGTLALRNFPGGEKTFKAFLGELKQKVLAAFENQDYPFEQLAGKVAARVDTSRNPVFDTLFLMENEAERSNEYLLEALMVYQPNPFRTRKSKFDMTLLSAETGEGLHFNLEYNINLFKEETIDRFLRYYKRILSSISAAVDQKIVEIDIIPDEERAMILYLFNDTEAEYPKNRTVHELFAEQSARKPGNAAVAGHDLLSGREVTLSYRELNARANQLARVLQGKGMLPEQVAAIMVEPSTAMIVGILAILKSGGGFLPIDHKIPGDRIKYMLEDSGVSLFLTCRQLLGKTTYDVEVIAMDDAGLTLTQGNESNLELVNTPDDLCYVIYTSGSTGRPKGVLGEHRPLINLCYWYNRYFLVTPKDRCTKYASFGFDASVWEIFPNLLKGASLYIIPEEIKLDIERLYGYFQEKSITISFLPTQVAEQFMTREIPPLRVLQAAGDKLKSVVKNDYDLYNCYGPTENTVCATSYPVRNFSPNIPIGAPIANNHIYILDKNGHLQPICIPGELCVGGESVARGYMNNPELTHEKFMKNPYPSPMPLMQSPRLYRTGDLARWLQDGNIEFLGRIDYQVKIRGYRIELGEIENQLMHLEEIKGVVVVVREDCPAQKYLCAYVVAEKNLDIESIKKRLSKRLPAYMIPLHFVYLENIPLNPSGKIDQKQLPAPEIKGTDTYAAPNTEVEKIMAKIWSEVLGREKVGIDDHFFEIGGDSIKTILVSGRLEKCRLSIAVNDFFANPTIRKASLLVRKLEPKPGRKAVSKTDESLSLEIRKDYQRYLQQINQEQWPELNLTHDYRHLLLTGATGYLGAYLVPELLAGTTAIIYLPVRGATQENAEKRFREKMAFYFGEHFYNNNKERLVVLRADLRGNRLGIDGKHYEKLAAGIEAVLHSAANVKHYGVYDELYKDNVEATEHLLEFAITARKKDFHFISTLDTGRGEIPGKPYLVFTESCHDMGQNIDHLYIKSKIAAEKKVLDYRDKGLNALIYRVGNVTFHSDSGRFQQNIENNAFYAVMRGIIKVGFFSENMKNIEFNLSFVNHTARAIVLLLSRRFHKETFHIANPHTIHMKEMEAFLKRLGFTIKNWPEVRKEFARGEADREYENIIERVKLDAWAWEEKPVTLTVPKVDRTVKLLEQLGFKWPGVTEAHIKRMMDWCREVGFI